ncbi:MAG: HIRAN domain-containing protein [bacterium]|nr:HIRAN domain-containing protein [Betaproteobacteria bacterium]
MRQAFVALALWVVLPGTAAAAATGTGTETTTPTLTPPPAVAPTPTPTAIEAMIVVRSSPLAGFQFHAGEELFAQMQVGDRLALVREPDNPHDRNAVRVEWRQVKLGYVPRRDNPQVARQMDLGAALEARVSRLRAARNPWDRIEFEVVLVLPR